MRRVFGVRFQNSVLITFAFTPEISGINEAREIPASIMIREKVVTVVHGNGMDDRDFVYITTKCQIENNYPLHLHNFLQSERTREESRIFIEDILAESDEKDILSVYLQWGTRESPR